MSTRIDGSGAAASTSVRSATDRGPVREAEARERKDGLRKDLVSTFKAAFRLDVTSDVLSEIRDRLVTLRAGLQVATDGADKRDFVQSTLGSISRLVDVAKLGPAEWPDVPPREPEPGEVLSPLEESLLATVSPELLLPDFSASEEAGADAPEPRTSFVDRAISEVDAAHERVRQARGEVGLRASGLVSGRMRSDFAEEGSFSDAETAEATARALLDRFATDPAGAMRAMGELDPEAVLTLIA